MNIDTVLPRATQARDRMRFRARFAKTGADVVVCQALRGQLFRRQALPDRDAFDDICEHLLIERVCDGALVATCRVLRMEAGRDVHRSYSAQFYDLARLARYKGRLGEVGRFCIARGQEEADILRVAWAALAGWVDKHSVEMLFGCSSFQGVDPSVYEDCFGLLAARHLAPPELAPREKASAVWPYARLAEPSFDRLNAMKRMPPLLRSYLTMGGWVSDHAVIDRELGTLHVFTGLEIARIPPARARALRSVAALLGEQALT